MDLKLFKEKLEKFGVIFEAGLNDKEILFAEQKYQFKFPPDLKQWLQYALPIQLKDNQGMKFPNWRNLENKDLKFQMDGPLEGILFDVENNNYWLNELGNKPADLEEAKSIISDAINKAPKLIPVYGHRYLPSEPLEEGNPILSVHQTDIIYYGNNLWGYLDIEFGSPGQMVIYVGDSEEPKKIKFWSRIIESNK